MSEKIDDLLRSAIADGTFPGVVAMAADRRGVIYEGAAGRRAANGRDPITADTMLRVASMTKIVTTVAALQLWERGDLELDAPVDTYRPEFAELQVLEGFDGERPKLRPAAGRATVRQLMSHTAGLGYWVFSAEIDRWEQVTGTPNVLSGLEAAFTAPLVCDPGTRFEYGMNIEWLGLVVEAVSGRPLDVCIQSEVTAPLGMDSTTARMTEAQRANSVPVHVRDEHGDWVATDIDWAQEPDFWGGGGYLYTTPRDYLTFLQMLLSGGQLGEVRILDERTVDQAFTNQIGALEFPSVFPTAHPELSGEIPFGPGLKFGLGLLLNPVAHPGMRAADSGAWWGLLNTHFWVDRTRGVTGALFSQVLPFAEPSARQLYMDFEQTLYASR